MNESTKRKRMSEAHKGQISSKRGTHLSEEMKRKVIIE